MSIVIVIVLMLEFVVKVECFDVLFVQIGECYDKVKFVSSFVVEDMLFIYVILLKGVLIGIFLLNMGCLYVEMFGMIDWVCECYGYEIEQFYLQQDVVDWYVVEYGLNVFYESVELCKLCCYICKVELLNCVLVDVGVWVMGQCCEQLVMCVELYEEEQDEVCGIVKYNLFVDWMEVDVWVYFKVFDVLVNLLYVCGYLSIGCELCMCVICFGEDSCVGCWWWELCDMKECGLYVMMIMLIFVNVEVGVVY